jgi:hypothetical protein
VEEACNENGRELREAPTRDLLGAVLFQVQPLYRGSLRHSLLRLGAIVAGRMKRLFPHCHIAPRFVPFVPTDCKFPQHHFQSNGNRCQQASSAMQAIVPSRGVSGTSPESSLCLEVYQSASRLHELSAITRNYCLPRIDAVSKGPRLGSIRNPDRRWSLTLLEQQIAASSLRNIYVNSSLTLADATLYLRTF